MLYGYLIGVLLQGALVALTLAAPRRPRWLAGLAFRVAAAYNEAPFLFIYVLLASSLQPFAAGQFASPAGWLPLGLTGLVIAGLSVIAWRGAAARPVVQQALDEGLGAGWQEAIAPELAAGLRGRPPLAGILFMPFVFRPRDVERLANISYGTVGYGNTDRANQLDLYRHRSRPAGAPVLVYFHGGGFYTGSKSREARALLFRLASRGWVTISANYRLRPQAGFEEHLIDAKKVIAWLRQHGPEYGADPSMLVLSGGSAGGTLASLAALTQNEPRYQPGFEDVDTSLTAVASFYGWYGGYYGRGGPESAVGMLGQDASGAPPFFIAHGENDSIALVETTRRFVAHLRAGSPNPVVYAELPGGQHAFDLFHSFRFAAVVDGVEAFAAWARSREEPVGEAFPR